MKSLERISIMTDIIHGILSRYFMINISFDHSLHFGGMAIVFGLICEDYKGNITAQ